MTSNNNYFLVLDIETSTIYNDKEPLAVWLAYGYINLYSKSGNKIEDNYFRSFDTLEDILIGYSIQFGGSKIICYVHNLSYEFDFLIKNVSKPVKILSNKSRHIIMGTFYNFPNIEFRCSYLLSGYPLRKLGEIVGLAKLESEYRTIFPADTVNEEEKKYCCRDCDIVAKFIADICIKEYNYIFNIPYTKTGRVRKVLKELNKKETCKDWDLMPPENCYNAMCSAFSGGLCFSNPVFTDEELKNIRCFDISSSYPYVMLKELYPYKIKKIEKFDKNFVNKKCWIAKISFIEIHSRYNWGVLSISKMQNKIKSDDVYFNGKLIYSSYIERYITNVDFEIIKDCYNFDSFNILEFYDCTEKIDKLPSCIIETIEHFATKKGQLKEQLKKAPDNEELQKDYTLAKNDFNSIYGMMVQKLIQDEFIVNDNFEWEAIKQEYKQIPGKHLNRNFLFGIFTSAYARRNLIKAIIKNCPYTFVYSDTDSIKFFGGGKFIDTNLPLEEYKENKYIAKLGKFDEEKTYTRFKTLGAKKYVYKHSDKYKIISIAKTPGHRKAYKYSAKGYNLTVAGLPKNNIYRIYRLSDFRIGKVFENCKLGTKYTFDNICYYKDDRGKVIAKNESELDTFYKNNGIKTRGGVMLFPTSYNLSMTANDINIANDCKKMFNNSMIALSLLSNVNIKEYIVK